MTANRVARHDIQARSFKFACQIVFFCKSLANSTTAPWILVNQLLDSGTSIGANLEEAVAASSRRDFVAKCRVALKEARETLFWLRVFDACRLAPEVALRPLLGEADAHVAILMAIVRNAQANQRKNVILNSSFVIIRHDSLVP